MKKLQKFTMPDGERVFLAKSGYQIGGDAYVILTDDNRPYATLSVNVVSVSLKPGEVLIKTWSENADIAEMMLKLGFFRDTGRRIPCGHVEAKVWVYQGSGN